MVFIIDLDRYHDEVTIVDYLDGIRDLCVWESIEIVFISETHRFLDSAALLLVVTVYNEMKKEGYDNINVSFPARVGNDRHAYLSRINFFNLLDISFTESFNRRPTSGSMLEISNIATGSTRYGLTENVINIIESSFDLDEDTRETIVFVLNELICNITLHANSKNGGYIYCQKFPNRGCLELIIADGGIGIQNTMKQINPNISNGDALKQSMEFGVTSGNGHGMGLNRISTIVSRNKGKMTLISGQNSLHLNSGRYEVKQNSYWQGVVIRCIFNLSNKFTTEDYLEF